MFLRVFEKISLKGISMQTQSENLSNFPELFPNSGENEALGFAGISVHVTAVQWLLHLCKSFSTNIIHNT